MAEPTFELDVTGDEALSRALSAVAPRALAKHMHLAMVDLGSQWEVALKRRFSGYATGWRRRAGLFNRSGALRRSIRTATPRVPEVGKLQQVMNVGGAEAPYARVQEFGGVIKPRRRKFLTVPLPAALTASGQLKAAARIRPSMGGFRTDMGPTFIKRGPSGQAIIYANRGQTKGGKDRKPIALYVLKRHVWIPGPRSTGAPSRLGAIKAAQLTPHRMKFFEYRLRRALADVASTAGGGD